MNGNDSWKKTDEVQIDLSDLLCRLIAGWKQAAVCALAAALLLGGYGWIKNRDNTAELVSVEDEKLTKEEEQMVEDALRLEEETAELEDYMENSILMQVNPYCRNQVFLMFRINGATNHAVFGISENYLGFLTNGGITDMLQKTGDDTWKMDRRYLDEIITAKLKSDSMYSVVTDDPADVVPAEALLYIEVTGKDAKMAAKLAEDLQTVLKDYSSEVEKEYGRHELTLISSQKSVKIDNGLLAQRDEKKQMLKTRQESLKSMLDGFSRQQKVLYKKYSSVQKDGEEPEEESINGDNRVSVKYVLFGLAGGIGIYCAWFAFAYMLCDTVKSAEEFRTHYNLPFYGSISMQIESRKKQKIMRDHEREKAMLLNRTRLSCGKQGIGKLCLDAVFEPGVKEQTCLEELSAQLVEWGISVIFAGKIHENTSQWDAVTQTGSVLMICRAGVTTHRMIDEEMEFYLENGVTIIGAAVLED